jgi:hypothetical protein
MLFCHRWLLLCFKREFPEAEALRIWEACWAHYQVSRQVSPQASGTILHPTFREGGCRHQPSSSGVHPPARPHPQVTDSPHTATLPSLTQPALVLTSQVTEMDANCPLTALITTL